MSDQDFAFDLASSEAARNSTEAAPGPATDAPAPVVVVHYRNRGLLASLMPPALILLAASIFYTASRLIPDRPRVGAATPRSIAAVEVRGPDLAAKPVGEIAAPTPIIVEQVLDPVPSIDEAVPEPATTRVIEEDRPMEGSAISFVVPSLVDPSLEVPAPGDASLDRAELEPETAMDVGDAPADLAAEQPPPNLDAVWKDIAAEAARRESEARAMEALKERAPQLERIEAERREALEAAESRQRAEADRVGFRQELQTLIRAEGRQAGAAIRQFCMAAATDVPQSVEKVVNAQLERYGAKLDRRGRVELLRSHGLPESEVLNYLATLEYKNMNARGGPRNPNEAWVRAAMRLLTIPVRPSSSPARSE